MSRKDHGRRGSEPQPQASPGAEAAEAASAEPAAPVVVVGDEALPLEAEALAQAFEALPRAAGALPGSLTCVVKHGTVRRNGEAFEMGAALDLPRGEAEELQAAGVVTVR